MATKFDKDLDTKIAAAGRPQKKADGSWPSVDAGEWPSLKAVVVCATAGCPVEGIGFEVRLYVQVDGSTPCICGRCGEHVTDMRGDLTPVGEDKLAVLRGDPSILTTKQRDFNKQRGKTPTPKESK